MTLPEYVGDNCDGMTVRKNEGMIHVHGRDSASTSVARAVPANNVTAPRSGSNVSMIVEKSKKAASSLFTLLHAKNCTMGVHRCTHPGCAEAKLIYLHLKTCSVNNSEPCPTNHKGCADARKLLSHYRRCRDIRSRQVATRSRATQHVCLVCSLVARHAKGSMDRSTSPKGARSAPRPIIPPVGSEMMMHSRHRPRSTSPYRSSQPLAIPALPSLESSAPRTTPMKMPPPPPRFAFSNSNDQHFPNNTQQFSNAQMIHPGLYNNHNNNNYNNNNNINNHRHHMEVSASVRISPATGEMPLARSLDSSDVMRRRAESFDLRRSQEAAWRWKDPGIRHNNHEPVVDPYVVEEQVQARQEQSTTSRRRRSASYSVSSSAPSSAHFDPILEEPVEDLQRILEGDP